MSKELKVFSLDEVAKVRMLFDVELPAMIYRMDSVL